MTSQCARCCDHLGVDCTICGKECSGEILFTADDDPLFVVCEDCYDNENIEGHGMFSAHVPSSVASNADDGGILKKKDDAVDGSKVAHRNLICDGCDAHPIKGVRYKCNVCADFDLCEPCWRRGRHSEHTMTEMSMPQARHVSIACDNCNMEPILGIRWKCLVCPNYDLCQVCQERGVHSEHLKEMITVPRTFQQRKKDREDDELKRKKLRMGKQQQEQEKTEQRSGLQEAAVSDDDLKERMTCPVCMDKQRTVAFTCGHSVCLDCSPHLKTCPICRRKIAKRIQLHF